MTWSSEAQAFMERVPDFARGAARRSVEEHARKKGQEVVHLDDAKEVAMKMGMEHSASQEIPEAQVVVLTKTKKFAPDFHRHILRSKVQGQVVGAGDRILVYLIKETVPAGRVKVVESTNLEFR